MIRVFVLSAFLFLTLGCTKESSEVETTFEVKYEVLTTEGDWFGEYISETGEKICFCYPPLPTSGWTYSFEVTDKPFTLHIDATSETGLGLEDSPDVTTNIYVDNKLVSSNTSNWAPGVASADFEIK